MAFTAQTPRFPNAFSSHTFFQPVKWGEHSLPGQVAPAAGLEADDYVSDLQVSLLLQVGQYPSTEEHFALADAVQVTVQL